MQGIPNFRELIHLSDDISEVWQTLLVWEDRYFPYIMVMPELMQEPSIRKNLQVEFLSLKHIYAIHADWKTHEECLLAVANLVLRLQDETLERIAAHQAVASGAMEN